MSIRSFQAFCVLLTSAAIAVSIWLSVQLTEGQWFYPIDDTYIHLSLAETILDGGYGINSTEYASPSSSILYPLLLTFTTIIGLDVYGPFVLTLLPAVCTIWMVSGLFWTNLHDSFGTWKPIAFLLMAPLLILATNAVALPLTGMEHSLHVLSVCMIIIGLVRLTHHDRGLGMLIAGILIGGTIRFEGLALSGAALLALLYLGYWRSAVLTGAVLGAILAAYVVIMARLGLPFLPSSVMSKLGLATTLMDSGVVDAVKGFRYTLERSLDDRTGLLIALGGVFLFTEIFRKDDMAVPMRPIFAVVFFAIASHLLAGRYGWFERYEVYIITAMILGFVAMPRDPGRGIGGFASVVTVAGALGVIASPFFFVTLKVPYASRNIHEQQYQMHRFATEYFPYNVAINDLGWVSYKNDNYVLDLWGLGSETARLAMQDGLTGDETAVLADGKDVQFAMLFERIGAPDNWCRIGSLITSDVIAASDTVLFYLANPSREDEMRRAISAFIPTLPDGARFEAHRCNDQE